MALIRISYSVRRLGSVWAAVFGLLFYPASGAYAEVRDVAIVQSDDAGPYAEFSEALYKTLSGAGIAPVMVEAGKPIPDSGLVIGIGMKAATAVAASSAPSVLNVLIPKAGHERLLRDYPRRAGSKTFSAIFMDQPAHRQAHLIYALLPDKHNVGVLYSSPQPGLAQFRQTLAGHGLTLRDAEVNQAHPLSEGLQEVLQSSDVLLALPDTAIYNSSTLRNILLATYRSNVPLIGFSPGYVKAGALCAIFSTPAQIAAQVAELIRQFDDSDALPAAHYPHEFEVMVNEQVARSLGLQIKSAAVLHYEIKNEVGDHP